MTPRLSLFGGARLEAEGRSVGGRAAHRRRLGLLALLAASPRQTVGRERAVGLLWAGSTPDAARKLLSESLYVIRKEIGENVIIGQGDDITLDASLVGSDVADFRAAIGRGDLQAAVDLYAGPFLDAWYVDDAPEFDRWVDEQRDELRRQFVSCLGTLAEDLEKAGDWPGAVTRWRALLHADPYNSRAALRLARAHDAAGERPAALQALSAHETVLRRELDVAPPREVAAYARELRASVAPGIALSEPVGSAPAEHESPSLPQSQPVRSGWMKALVGAGAVAAIFAVVATTLDRPAVGLEPPLDPNEVAVRPFHDLSNRNTDFAYALTDELIMRLTGVPPIRVAPRSAIVLRDSSVGFDSVARALRVGTVIEGTVRESEGRLTVMAQVVNVQSGRVEGAIEVVGDPARPGMLLDDVAASIERNFRRRLGETFRLRELTRGTRNADAIRLVAEGQRALDIVSQVNREWRKDAGVVARKHLETADSVFALAGLADPRWAQPLLKRGEIALLHARLQGDSAQRITLAGGIRLLTRALQLDPNHGAALEMRGWLQRQLLLTYPKRDSGAAALRAAISDFERARSLDSMRVGAWIGRAFMGWYSSDTVAARINLDRATRLDAYLHGESDIFQNTFYVALWLRDWNAAREACRNGRRVDPWNYRFLQCELTLIRHDATTAPNPRHAWAVVDTLLRMHPVEKAAAAGRPYVPIYWQVVAATVSARAGQRREARAALDSAIAQAERAGPITLEDLMPDRAVFELAIGDTATARRLVAEYIAARREQCATLASDALLGAFVNRPCPVS